uniref:Uncharacterized protein n=1 Tax=Anopheles melas TaxID=34690 RepID=A0A182UBB6_9DIPT
MRNPFTVRDGGRAHVPRTAATLMQLIATALLLVWLGQTATAFNLDTINFILKEGDPSSMFGFSVALHREQNNSWPRCFRHGLCDVPHPTPLISYPLHDMHRGPLFLLLLLLGCPG